MRGLNEASGGRQQSPGEHNARDPFAGAPNLDQHRGGNFNQKVADEKDARTDAEIGIRKAQILGHVQRRVAQVDAIQVRNDVQDKQKRNQPPRDLAASAQREFGWLVLADGQTLFRIEDSEAVDRR